MLPRTTCLWLAGLLLMTACKKNSYSKRDIPPTATFTINGSESDTTKAGTFDQVILSNSTQGIKSLSWDFGDGRTSSNTDTSISFNAAGIYIITLQVEDSSNQKGRIAKVIRVLERHVKQIEIYSTYDNVNLIPAQSDPSDQYWIEIKLGGNQINYPFPTTNPITFNAPIIYISGLISNLTSDRLPFTINVTKDITINFPALAARTLKGLGYQGVGYGIELYKRSNADTVLLSSSFAAQVISQAGSISWPTADPVNDIFVAKYGDLGLVCDYK